MVRIASERTRAIVQTWGSAAIWGPVDIMVLAESCYMQGINDSVDAIHQSGNWKVPGIDEPQRYDEPID
jgi:hypothetical protein